MYSQKAQVAIMQVDGAPTVLPKEPTERLKLVATAVDAITEPPPKHTHTENHQRRRFDIRIRAGSDPRSWSRHDRVWGAEIGMGRSSGAACRPGWGRTRRARGGRPMMTSWRPPNS